METLELLMSGFKVAMQPMNILICTFGGILGIIVGAMPGLGSVVGVALLLPLTYNMNPTAAIIMLAALYYGNMFGGAISSILINIPGDAPAVMAAMDGYPMAKKGRGGQALFITFVVSFVGGFIGAIILAMSGSALAKIGLKFGPPEIAMVIFVAMTSIGWLLGDSPVKGLISTGLGLLLACIGMDTIAGQPRMTFGIFDLLSGIPFIPCIIGLFGLSQVIQTMVGGIHKKPDLNIDKITYKNSFPSKDEWKRTIGPTLRGSFLGFFIGLLPGSGATTATFLSYTTEKRINKNGHLMGTGVPEGIAASEAADNAASIGSFAPLLSLGIPGSGTSAVLLGGLMMWGLQPGPLFMTENPEFSWTLIASMFVGDFILIIICLAAIPILANILKVPNTILVPVILCVSMLGAYSVNNSMFDIYIMIIAGAIGYLLVRFEIPLAPIALSLILGPSLETAIRQSFSISSGNPAVFFTRPLSLGIFIVGVFLIIMPIITNSIKKKKPTDITKAA